MECCENKEKYGGKKMDIKKAVLWGVIAVLFLAVVYVTFFKGSFNTEIVGASGQAAAKYSGMVGGC
ncbi:MAG: hypothetical protein AABX28_03590 [Nanoarchaeota archaeon]